MGKDLETDYQELMRDQVVKLVCRPCKAFLRMGGSLCGNEMRKVKCADIARELR